jgi:hypothetical protein
MQGSRPQTIGYSLLDSPAGLCAWIFEKLWSWSDHHGDLYEVLGRDQVLDNITLYWLTGTGASSARLYWESIGEISTWFSHSISDSIDVPTGCTVFPREVPLTAAGRAALYQHRLLGRAASRRPLRSLGAARPVRPGGASGTTGTAGS